MIDLKRTNSADEGAAKKIANMSDESDTDSD
jgi:hypothetical protein